LFSVLSLVTLFGELETVVFLVAAFLATGVFAALDALALGAATFFSEVLAAGVAFLTAGVAFLATGFAGVVALLALVEADFVAFVVVAFAAGEAFCDAGFAQRLSSQQVLLFSYSFRFCCCFW
jgi:hypothetical protein